VLRRCFTQGLGLARSTCSTASFKKFRAWVCSNLVKMRSGRPVVVTGNRVHVSDSYVAIAILDLISLQGGLYCSSVDYRWFGI
jgi:hypothetical protein